MDSREQAFKAKFESAAQHLGVTHKQVISLKLRDTVSSYDEYQEMLHVLEQEAGLRWTEVHGDLQGRGYLVEHDDQKVIMVEHETGLEILYVAGAIASLVGLVPLLLQYWGTIRGYLDRGHSRHFRSVEIRRLDNRGKLREDHSRGLAGPSAFPLSVLNTALSSAARVLDADLHALRKEVRSLGERLATIESQLKPKKKRPTANKSSRSRSKSSKKKQVTK